MAVTHYVPGITRKEVTHPVETVTPVLPSEAIKIGIMVRPRSWIGSFFHGDDQACVLGAMAIGLGYDPQDSIGHPDPYKLVNNALPDQLNPPCGHAKSSGTRYMPSELLYHLNDTHQWERSVIAEWLRQQGL